eukprot:gnl/TRDRNA2_/TRDRNA2_166493_c0_seq2.p1 gnl/TRDRNA2_/TRDRNA2_166493_c0~~gnl/TRDRNA2_/TRDRNA2_166493_c0_seq2.p1  ORF type:complete len:296 (-),score=52.98 gnl/TRDRNA2_/TRDRNA2_166493_c0_seq2:497-1384(-)
MRARRAVVAAVLYPELLGVARAIAVPPPADNGSTQEAVQEDVAHTERLMEWLGDAFHSTTRFDNGAWSNVSDELDRLAELAMQTTPTLSFAVGMGLYSYFWWEGQGGYGDAVGSSSVNVPASQLAAALMHHSIQHFSCDAADIPVEDFFARRCHVRWRQLMLLSAELARYLAVELMDVRGSTLAMRKTTELFQVMLSLPFFRQYMQLGAVLRGPQDVNFNHDYYPHVNIGPVWPAMGEEGRLAADHGRGDILELACAGLRVRDAVYTTGRRLADGIFGAEQHVGGKKLCSGTALL